MKWSAEKPTKITRRNAVVNKSKTAYWIETIEYSRSMNEFRVGLKHYNCSNCNSHPLLNRYSKYDELSPFCPFCGYIMKGIKSEQQN